MSNCYNKECPFSKGWPHDCDCSDLCGGYTSEEVIVYTTNRTTPRFVAARGNTKPYTTLERFCEMNYHDHYCDGCLINDDCLNSYIAESEVMVGCKDYIPKPPCGRKEKG